jgi:hypothetical protein
MANKLKTYQTLYVVFTALTVLGLLDLGTSSLVKEQYGLGDAGYVMLFFVKMFGVAGFYIGFLIRLLLPALFLAFAFQRKVRAEKKRLETNATTQS